MNRFILASGSPRRRELLALLGYSFEVIPAPPFDEALLLRWATSADAGESGPPGELLYRVGFADDRLVARLESLQGDWPLFDEPLERLAWLKGALVAQQNEDMPVLSADTEVYLGGVALGKPVSADDAARMLLELSGGEHIVRTSVVLSFAPDELCEARSASTIVRFRRFGRGLAERYVRNEHVLDKAGAYAIQGFGALLIDSIAGDYSNVIGLPVSLVAELLAAAGIAPQAP